MLDEMPKSKKASAAGPDRISALPDALLHHVLGFLHAREAVQTCVLAQRWRHVWKSLPVLRLTRDRGKVLSHKFLNHVLLLRDHAPLDVCLFEFSKGAKDELPYINLWIRCALLCQVRALTVTALIKRNNSLEKIYLDNLPVVSQYLKKLELSSLQLYGKFLDFSSCPVLMDLLLTYCYITADKVSSQSLTCLTIEECRFSEDTRTRISTPSLISVRLVNIYGRTPFFEDMPSLGTATVQFNSNCVDFCDNDDSGYCGDASCDGCYGTDDGSAGCVLLRGLSAATKLKLISNPKVFILKRDLRFCPIFSKLKTLFVKGWCLDADLHALICILKHSPILEDLTIDLFGNRRGYYNLSEDDEDEEPKQMVPTVQSKAIFHALEQPFTLDNLNQVKVKCYQVDLWVFNILKSLITSGIPPKKISIQQKSRLSEYVSLSPVQVLPQGRAEVCAAHGLTVFS
ncbi:hypothetical protein ACP70R_003812 [Stipagrostis hirtigluma subsp. patula]